MRLYLFSALLAALAAVHPLPLAAQPLNLPDLGEQSQAVISPAEERRLGDNFIRAARRQLHFLDDPELNTYLNDLGGRLARQSGAGGEFHFFIIDNPDLNAFAVPGGYVGVHTGLVLAARNEAELASVLAHEVAHVSQRHLPRMLVRAKQQSLPTMAAIIAAAMLGGQAGEAAIALSAASQAKRQLDYTREFEREADRIGMQILAGAGFDPRAMPDFFERLQQNTRAYETGLPDFLRTHPVTSDRIAESRARAENLPAGRRDSLDFRKFQARVRVVTAKRMEDARAYFAAKLAEAQAPPQRRLAWRYGHALALLAAGRHEAARTEAQRLLAARPDDPDFLALQGEIALSAGRTREAVEVLGRAHRRHPDNPSLVRYYGEALLRAGRPAEAQRLLGKAVRARPRDPSLQRLLARAATANGDPLSAHRAMAEYYYLNGNTHAAIDQLQIAARLARGNFYHQSSVEARLQEIQNEMARFQGGS